MLLGALNELSKASMLSAERKPIAGSKDFKLAPKHDLIAMVALEELDPHAAAFLHRRAGEVLESELGENTQDTALLWACAQHWQKAGETARAYDLAMKCGKQLFQVGLPVEAAEAFHRAGQYSLTTEQAVVVLSMEADALERGQSWSRLTSLLKDRDNELNPRNRHDEFELRYLNAAWRLSLDSKEAFARASRCANAGNASIAHRAMGGSVAIKIASNDGEWDTFDRIYSELIPVISELPASDETRLEIEMIYHTMRGDINRAVGLAEAFVLGIRSSGNVNRTCWALANSADVFYLAGESGKAEAALRDALDISATHRCFRLAKAMSFHIARMFMDRGDTTRARRELERFTNLDDVEEDPLAAEKIRNLEAQLLIEEGKLSEAAELCRSLHSNVHLLAKPRRGLILATLVRLKVREEAIDEELSDILQALEANHLEYRSAGWQDYESMSLYLGLTAAGQGRKARRLLCQYVSKHRRDRSPVPPYIARVLKEAKP